MISFIHESEQAPWSDKIAKLHAEFTDRKITEALTLMFGQMPSFEDIVAHCQCFIDADNVSHYVWFENGKPAWVNGETVNLSQAFLSIAPPQFGGPMN